MLKFTNYSKFNNQQNSKDLYDHLIRRESSFEDMHDIVFKIMRKLVTTLLQPQFKFANHLALIDMCVS